MLSRVVRHERHGAIGLPVLGHLYVRKRDVPAPPPSAGIAFRTEIELAAEQVTWLRSELPDNGPTAWLVVDGGYAKRKFLEPAKAAGFVVVARPRKDAALFDLPPVLPPGRTRGRGRPPIYGKGRLSLAKRAGPRRGWRTVEARSTTGAVVPKRNKPFLATWRPAGGVVRVVRPGEDDGSWRAFLCTDPEADAEAIVQAVLDRWPVEQGYRQMKEGPGPFRGPFVARVPPPRLPGDAGLWPPGPGATSSPSGAIPAGQEGGRRGPVITPPAIRRALQRLLAPICRHDCPYCRGLTASPPSIRTE